MKLSLKTKLILMFSLLIILSISTLGVTSYLMANNALQTTIEGQLKQLCQMTANSIDQNLKNAEGIVSLIKNDGELERLAAGDLTAKKEVGISILDEAQKQNSELIENLFLIDATGKVLAMNSGDGGDLNLSDRDYFKEAIGGKSSVSEVIASKTTGNMVTVVAQPISYNGKVVGAVAASMNFGSITKEASTIKIGKGGYAYLLDKDLLAVAHPVKENVLKLNLNKVDSADLKKLLPTMSAMKAGEGFYTYNGVYKYVRFQPAGKWLLALTANYDDYMSSAIQIRNMTALIVGLSILISILIAYLYSTLSIVNPIKKLQMLMELAGEGDLTVKSNIRTGDEIEKLGDSFNRMIDHQAHIVGNVRHGADELSKASTQMADSTTQISAATEEVTASITEVSRDAIEQERSIVETSEVLVQLSSLVQIAKTKAVSACENSVNSVKTAQVGRNKVDQTVKAMDGINESTNETAAVMDLLNDLSKKIGGIITTINGIAEQTNLLALNAAIEAARAGEHGKGFAVVADEVRKLSEQSNQGAREISDLVGEMITQTENAVRTIESGKEAVSKGVEIVRETGSAFADIIQSVEKIVQNTNEIVEITKDEVASSEQIINLINKVANSTESTSRSSQEVAAASEEQAATLETLAATAEEISAMAISLDSMVNKFKTEA